MSSIPDKTNLPKANIVVLTLLSSLLLTGCATSSNLSTSTTLQRASLNAQPSIQLEIRPLLPWALVGIETPFNIHITNLGESMIRFHDETVIEMTCKAGRDTHTQTFRASEYCPENIQLALAPGQHFEQEVRFSTRAITEARSLTFQATLKTVDPTGGDRVQLTQTRPSKMKVLSEEQLAQAFGSIKQML